MAKSEAGTENWLTTYADFITLLMTFFIVLYTLTAGVEEEKFEALIDVFQGNDGMLKNESVLENKMISIEMQRAKNWADFNKTIKEHNWEDDVKFEILSSGVKITLGEDITFETYSAILASEAKKILHVIAHSIEKYTKEPLKIVQVFGHTDNRPVLNKTGKFANNWELGAARAISVVRFLIKNSVTPPKKFEVITFGEYRPIASNATSKGRRKNRRVEIFVKYVLNDSVEVKKNTALSSSSKYKYVNYE